MHFLAEYNSFLLSPEVQSKYYFIWSFYNNSETFNKFGRLIFLFSLLFFISCEYSDDINPYSSQNKNFKQPAFRIDSLRSTFSPGDTISSDCLILTLVGNSAVNRFRWRLDSTVWYDWGIQSKGSFVISISGYKTGFHSVGIQVCYDPEGEITDSAIYFFRVEPAAIKLMSSNSIFVDSGASCTLWVEAIGTPVLHFAWFHDSVEIDSAISDTMVLNNVSPSDSGLYICRVSHEWDTTFGAPILVNVSSKYSVLYNGNGNDSGRVPLDTNQYHFNDLYTVSGNTGNLFKRGFSFCGWNTMNDASGTNYLSDTTITMEANNLILYAMWAVNFYTINFIIYSDDLDSTINISKVSYGAKVIIPSEINLQKPGHLFNGWNTQVNGHGSSFPINSEFIMPDTNLSLYAQWIKKRFSVVYDGNGATTGEVPDSAFYDYQILLKVAGPNSLKMDCHTFIGWNSDAHGCGTILPADTTICIDTVNMRLYAQWTTNRHTITYKGNENSTGDVPSAVVYDCGQMIMPAEKGNLFKEGFSFTGWNTRADGKGIGFSSDTSFPMPDSDMVLYADWIINRCIVIYDGNGNTSGKFLDTSIYSFGETVKVGRQQNLTCRGHKFTGWNTISNGTGTPVAETQEFIIKVNEITLYAQWTASHYIIYFKGNLNDSGNVPDTMVRLFNTTFNIPGNVGNLQKKGYSFINWNDLPDASGRNYSPDTLITMQDNDLILYAHWEPNLYWVIYDGNGSTGGTLPLKKQYYYDSIIAIAEGSSFYKTGHTFKEWNTDPDGEGLSYLPDSSFSMGFDLKLYAQWIKNKHTVTYYGNSQSIGEPPSSREYEYQSSVVVKDQNTLFKNNYRFDCWYSQTDGYGTRYKPNVQFTMPDSDLVLFAFWTPVKMTRIFSNNSTYQMGCGTSMSRPDEQPPHPVTFTFDFWIDTTEVTQASYHEIMYSQYAAYEMPSWSDSCGFGGMFPAYNVSWYDAVLYCNGRTKMYGPDISDTVYTYTAIIDTPGRGCKLVDCNCNFDKTGFRLPTEAEWEYACRGGTETEYYWGDDSVISMTYALYMGNSGNKAGAIAQKLKNPFDLYDMSGNVSEWCNDWFGSYNASSINPTGSETGDYKVLRGGNWSHSLIDLRSARRFIGTPSNKYNNAGFRCIVKIGKQ